MAITADDLHPQLSAALRTFEKMSAKERETRVSKIYAEHFNDLLALSKEAMPAIESRRWPKPITLIAGMSGGQTGDANYSDVRAMLAEIDTIVGTGVSPLPFSSF